MFFYLQYPLSLVIGKRIAFVQFDGDVIRLNIIAKPFFVCTMSTHSSLGMKMGQIFPDIHLFKKGQNLKWIIHI
jgi:hypothetical protein